MIVYRRFNRQRSLSVILDGIGGLTSLSMKSDPEEIRTTIIELRRVCSGIIERFGGIIASFVGETLLAHFGFPKAHEDDAVRALRASLELAALSDRLAGC